MTYYKPHALQRSSSLADRRHRGVEVAPQLLQTGFIPDPSPPLDATVDLRARAVVVAAVLWVAVSAFWGAVAVGVVAQEEADEGGVVA